jgi:hypothetical protein
MHGVGAAANESLCKIGIDVVLSDPAKVVQIILRRIFAEVGAGDVGVAQGGYDTFDVLHAVMHHAEAAPGEPRIAAALFFRSTLE